MRNSAEMCSVSALLVMFTIGVTTAQFKILGLLDANMGSDRIDSASPLVKISSFDDQSEHADTPIASSGQARGFSVEALDKAATAVVGGDRLLQQPPAVVPERVDNVNVIKVRIMEEPVQRVQLVPVEDSALRENAISINNGLEADAVPAVGPPDLDIKQQKYSRAFQPNIRKFSYIEERSFHQNGKNRKTFADNTFDGAINHNGYTNYKTKKVIAYRNHYKSRCRCQRIWNCPKIQITIHRCEQDYFMCCF